MRTIKIENLMNRTIEMRSLTMAESRNLAVKVKNYLAKMEQLRKESTTEKEASPEKVNAVTIIDVGLEAQDEICDFLPNIINMSKQEIDKNMDWDELAILWDHFSRLNKTFLQILASFGIEIKPKIQQSQDQTSLAS